MSSNARKRLESLEKALTPEETLWPLTIRVHFVDPVTKERVPSKSLTFHIGQKGSHDVP